MNRDELIKILKADGIACDRAEEYIGEDATELDQTGVCVYLDDPDNETVNFYLYPADNGGWRTVDGIWSCSGDVLGDGDVVGYVQKQQMEYNSNFSDWDPVAKARRALYKACSMWADRTRLICSVFGSNAQKIRWERIYEKCLKKAELYK